MIICVSLRRPRLAPVRGLMSGKRQIDVFNRFVYLCSVLIAYCDTSDASVSKSESHGLLPVFAVGESAFPNQFHTDHTHAFPACLFDMRDDVGHIAQALCGALFGIHGHSLMLHPHHRHLQPSTLRHLTQRGQSMNRSAAHQYLLSDLCFLNSFLPAEAVGGPG